MRIIAGTAKGRKLFAPKSPLVRPAADKVKGAIFNILGSIEGSTVLDLFAGSGNVGLEALSREAVRAVFVESLPESITAIRKNADNCHFSQSIAIFRGKIPDILRLVKKKEGVFDLVFIDPPYDKGLLFPTLKGIHENKLIDASARIIIEHSPRESPECEGFEVVDQRKYGQTIISFLKKAEHLALPV